MGIETLLVIAIATAVVSATQQVVQHQEEKDAASYNKKLMEGNARYQADLANNARLHAENEAISKERDTRRKVILERQRNQRLKALNTARTAGSGIGQAGTPLLFALEQAESMEMNKLEIRRHGQKEAEGIRYQGLLLGQKHDQASLDYTNKAKAITGPSNLGLALGLTKTALKATNSIMNIDTDTTETAISKAVQKTPNATDYMDTSNISNVMGVA